MATYSILYLSSEGDLKTFTVLIYIMKADIKVANTINAIIVIIIVCFLFIFKTKILFYSCLRNKWLIACFAKSLNFRKAIIMLNKIPGFSTSPFLVVVSFLKLYFNSSLIYICGKRIFYYICKI